MSPSSLLRLKIKNESNRPANCLYCLKGEKPRSPLYASQFSSFFLSFSLSNWSSENMLLSFSTFAVSDISCFVDDFTQPIEWFHVGPIKSSLLLHLILVAGTPLSRALAYTLRHDAWYFVSQDNRPKPLICLNIFKSPFLDSNLHSTLSFENTDSLSSLNALHVFSLFLYYKICSLV